MRSASEVMYTVSMGSRKIIVDKNDTPIGSKHSRNILYEDIYRVTALWLTDEATGNILLSKRKWNKRNDPGKWGTAVAGTVEVGETYESNILKEIEEEIGLKQLRLKKGPKMFTDDGTHKFFCQWFLASVDKHTVHIIIQEDELEAVKWVSGQHLLDDLKRHPGYYIPSMPEHLHALGIT